MPESAAERDRQVFAPRPKPITFVLDDGTTVATELFNFMDLPLKEAQEVYLIEEEMRADTVGGFVALVGYLRRLVVLLCPKLDPAVVEHLAPRQIQDAIGASYGVVLPSPEAEGARAASNPSPSAGSITSSPTASTGAP